MNAQSDPFAGMPNADDSENGEFSPAKITPSMPRGLDIIERTGEAEYYLREARRAGLPLPAYVTVSSHHHSSHIGIQLAGTEDVRLWALHFGTQPVISHGSISAELGYAANHKVDAYYVFPKPDRKPVPPQPPMTDTMSGDYVPGLAEHTQAVPVTQCTCEYQSHFNGFGHPYQGCPAGNRSTKETGPICDDCANTHYAEFVTELDAHTQAACDTIKAASASIRCPAPGDGHEIQGCGSSNVVFDQDDGVFECLDCGICFDQAEAACDTITRASQ